MRRYLIVPLIAAALLLGCSSSNKSAPATTTDLSRATAALIVDTVTPSPSPSPSPTPSRTPSPTPTPAPTPSPSPTPAPTPAAIAESVAPVSGGCPIDQPVKVGADNQAYNTDHPGYAASVPKSCYTSVLVASKAGFQAAALPTQAPPPVVTRAPTLPPTLAPTIAAPVAPAPAPAANGATPQCPNGFIPYEGNGRGVTLCKDGLCSHSTGRGTCSGHGGAAVRIGHSDVSLAA